MTKQKEEEVAKAANASETTNDESGSEKETSKENLDKSQEELEEGSAESKEEVSSDYLEKGDKEEKVDYKKRYSDSTREFQSLKTEKDKLSTALDNLEKLSKANPKIMAEIEAAKGMSGQSTLIQQQIDDALEPVKKATQELQNKESQVQMKVLANFEKKNPTLFPTNASAEEKRAIRQKIGKVANTLVETGMSFKNAVDRAYLTINPKAAVQKGKDEAYLEGLGEETASFSGQSSTEGKKSGKPKYTQAELAKAKKFGDKYYKSMINEK